MLLKKLKRKSFSHFVLVVRRRTFRAPTTLKFPPWLELALPPKVGWNLLILSFFPFHLLLLRAVGQVKGLWALGTNTSTGAGGLSVCDRLRPRTTKKLTR